MPNATQYREAAARFRVLCDSVGRHAIQIDAWPVGAHLSGGAAADAVAGSLAGTARQMTSASAMLARLAVVCDQRASVCDDYRRRLDAWNRLNVVERWIVERPVPPFPWVSV